MEKKKQIRSTCKNSIISTSISLYVLMSQAINTYLYISSKQSNQIAGRQSKTAETDRKQRKHEKIEKNRKK